jgi:hypothetical protein
MIQPRANEPRHRPRRGETMGSTRPNPTYQLRRRLWRNHNIQPAATIKRSK